MTSGRFKVSAPRLAAFAATLALSLPARAYDPHDVGLPFARPERPFLLVDAERRVVPGTPASVRVQLRGGGTVRVAVFRLRDPASWARRAQEPDGIAVAGDAVGRTCEGLVHAQGPLPRRDGAIELVRDESVTLATTAAARRTGGDETEAYDSSDSDEGSVETRWVHAGRWSDQRVSLGALPEGLYLVRVHAGAYAASALVSVSDLTLLVRRGDRHDTVLTATAQGVPLAGVEVSVGEVASARTDARGELRVEAADDLVRRFVAHRGDAWAWADASHARLDACDVRVYLDPGRPAFRRGETLHLRGHVRGCVNGREVPLARESVAVNGGAPVATDADGNFVTDYAVDSTAMHATVRGREHVRTVVIDDRALPQRALVVTADRAFAAAGETVRVRASDDAGRWPSEATVSFELMGQRRSATVGPDHAAEVSFVMPGVTEAARREAVTASLAHDGRVTLAQTEVWTGRSPVLLHVEAAAGAGTPEGTTAVWARAENLGGESLRRGVALRVFGSDGNRATGPARWAGRVETASGDTRAEVRLPGAGPWWVTASDERGEAAEAGTVVWERERPPDLGARGSLSVRPASASVVAGGTLPVDVTRPAGGATWVTLEQSGVWASAWIPAGPAPAGQAWWRAVLGVPADAGGGASVVATQLANGAVESATAVAGVASAPPLSLGVATDARVYAEGARMHATLSARSPDGAPRDAVVSVWLADAGYWDLAEERYPAVDAMLAVPGRPASGADSARPRHWGADEGRHLDPRALWNGEPLPHVTRYDAWNAGGSLVTFAARGSLDVLATALARAAGLRAAVVCAERSRATGVASLDAADVPWDLLADRVAARTDTHPWVSGDVLHLGCDAGPSRGGFGGLGSGSGVGYGGGGLGLRGTPREQRLEGDLFFLGARHLGSSGRLELDIPLPAHPGRWRLQALAIDAHGRGDRAFAVVATSRALTASVDAPTVLRPGDRAEAALTVHAPSLAGQRVEVAIEGDGVTVTGAAPTATLDAQGDARVGFALTATRPGAATVVGRVRAGTAQDAVRAGVTVREDDAVQPVGLRFTVAGAATDVDVPVPALSREGELRVSVDAGVLEAFDEALAALAAPRWVVPSVLVERLAALRTLSRVAERLPETQRPGRDEAVHAALTSTGAQLRALRALDGGVGWWRTGPSSGWVTATLLIGLDWESRGEAWREAWAFVRERAAVARGDEAARIVEALAYSRESSDAVLTRAVLAGLEAEPSLSVDATRGAFLAARHASPTTAARWGERLRAALAAALTESGRVECRGVAWFLCFVREGRRAEVARAMATLTATDAATNALRAQVMAWLAARPATTTAWWWGSAEADVVALRAQWPSGETTGRFVVRVGDREAGRGDAAHPVTVRVRDAGSVRVAMEAEPGRLVRVRVDGALTLAPVSAPTGTVALERRVDQGGDGATLALRWTLPRAVTGVELVVPLPAGVEVARPSGGRARVRATDQDVAWWSALDRRPGSLRPMIERRDGALVLRMERLDAGDHALTLPLVTSAGGHFTAGGAWLRSDDPGLWGVTPPVEMDARPPLH